jgi:mRNA interferase MazF
MAAVSMPELSRGQVYWADVAGIGRKPWLIVSNNRRNRNLPSVLAVRITTTAKYAGMPTVVTLAQSDPVTGFVVCDDLWPVYREEVSDSVGALAPPTMRAVNDALKAALSLP